jgi:hypothetical protein
MKFINNWDSHKTTNLIAAISLIAVIVNFVCDQDERVKQHERDRGLGAQAERLTSLSIQPRLKLEGNPTIDLAVVRSHFDPTRVKPPIPPDTIPTVDAEVSVSLKTTLHFKNKGTHLAKLIALVHLDTAGVSARIRDIILKETFDTSRSTVKDLRRISDVLPGDSVNLTFEADLTYFASRADTLHYYILYQNELGNFYDTYVWVPIAVSEISYLYRRIPGTNTVISTRSPSNLRDLIKLTGEPLQEFYTYTIEEAKKVDKFAELLRKQLH